MSFADQLGKDELYGTIRDMILQEDPRYFSEWFTVEPTEDGSECSDHVMEILGVDDDEEQLEEGEGGTDVEQSGAGSEVVAFGTDHHED